MKCRDVRGARGPLATLASACPPTAPALPCPPKWHLVENGAQQQTHAQGNGPVAQQQRGVARHVERGAPAQHRQLPRQAAAAARLPPARAAVAASAVHPGCCLGLKRGRRRVLIVAAGRLCRWQGQRAVTGGRQREAAATSMAAQQLRQLLWIAHHLATGDG